MIFIVELLSKTQKQHQGGPREILGVLRGSRQSRGVLGVPRIQGVPGVPGVPGVLGMGPTFPPWHQNLMVKSKIYVAGNHSTIICEIFLNDVVILSPLKF